jgi:hypothetical protein
MSIHRAKSEALAQLIRSVPHTYVPGNLAASHYYWLFPVVVPHPKQIAALMTQDVCMAIVFQYPMINHKHPRKCNRDDVHELILYIGL